MPSTTPLPDPEMRHHASAEGALVPPDAHLPPPPPPPMYGFADSQETDSVSFAPNGTRRPVTRPASPYVGAEGHALIGVGPGGIGPGLRGGLVTGYPFPITGAKIHPPLLRQDTLSRPRLNEWLDRAAEGRVALIVAEAGFGKTTLLADWASTSKRRTAWYRLEHDDRDWLVFLRHLVAAGRELDPEFGAESLELILALGAGGPTQADIVASLVTEYADFGAALPDGLTLIIDDHHVIDGSAETDAILRALIDRTGEGFSIVLASRAAPRLRLGRLRTTGGVSRLDGKDLCFDVPETDRLFRVAYRRPLEADVVGELIKRTEGWAALLTLVRTSLEDKNAPEARALVAQLSATRGDLYDFLAEEVLATLSPRLQRFLTRVSLLVSVDVRTGELVDEQPGRQVAELISEAEALGLLSRPDRETPHRFHPLVRDFLLGRLYEEVGSAEVGALHARVAAFMEPEDWSTSAWHYRAAGMPDRASDVLDHAVPAILASGQFELASDFLDGSAGSPDRPAGQMLRSRVELERGNYERALALAASAHATAPQSLAPTAILNLAFMRSVLGFDEEFAALASSALEGTLPSEQADLATAALLVAESQNEGDLEEVAELLVRLRGAQTAHGHRRYAGVTSLNLAWVLLWVGRPREALESGRTAEILLGASATSIYRVGALMVQAQALARMGRWEEAKSMIEAGLMFSSSLARREVAIEGGTAHLDFGGVGDAEALVAAGGPDGISPEFDAVVALPRAVLAIRKGDLTTAASLQSSLAGKHYRDVGGRLRVQLLTCRVAVATNRPEAADAIQELRRLADRQRSVVGMAAANILSGFLDGTLSDAVLALGPGENYVLSMLAEPICVRLHTLRAPAMQRIASEAALRPGRWQSALHLAIHEDNGSLLACAQLLAEIGSPADAALLRELATRVKRLKPIALAATRRVAQAVTIADLGSVSLYVGPDRIAGRLRRKVVGLLCFLSSRPGMSATRDEALEALWGDLGSDTAGNSLHQTIYFLRRIFEPDYKEGLSAGYVDFDGEVVTLNAGLVDTASRRVWRHLAKHRQPDLEAADALLQLYTGRYALDFAYEDWAAPYREHLHAAVLSFVEAGIDQASERDGDAAVRVARALLAVDPSADAIELALLRTYKSMGRRAAAAEQYAHYASVLRQELGVEPPPFEDV